MKRFSILIISLLIATMTWAASATEGVSYGGTTSAPSAASEPWWTVVGLSDGTVAVTAASYWTANAHKSVVFPTKVSVTYNNTTSSSMSATTFTVSQIGDGTYGVYIANSGDKTSEVTSVNTNGVTVAANAFVNMTKLTTYTITYNKGSYGTGVILSGTKYKGTSYTVSSTTFYREGYHQTGWATSDGGAKAYELGGTYTTDANSTLYPVWASGEPERENPCFLRGADLTMVNYIEDWGAKFYDHDGNEDDVFDILQTYGVNLARLRLYNAPGTEVQNEGESSYKYRTPYRTTAHSSGYPYAGPDDILDLAQRAKEHNMAVCLTFHLSDFWSNAGTQFIPSAWSSATTYAKLCDSVTNFVTDYMTRMVAQGTTPEYVSVGNETNWGMLFQKASDGTTVSYGGSGDRMSQFAGLFNAAYTAIKAVSSTTQVIFHHSMGHDGGITACQYLFDQLITTNGMNVDIIGGSYYPYWASEQSSADNSPDGMLAWASAMETRYSKPVMIMETGYSWTRYLPSGKNGGNYEGQLYTNGAYAEATENGQAAFLKMLHEAIASNDNILGYMYWDPIFVDQQVNGSWINSCWAERKYGGTWYYQTNAISNTTWFDFTGRPLKALYEEVNSWQEGCDEEPFVFNNSSGDGLWSTAANWSTGALPTAADDIRIYQPCTVDISTAVANSIVIATGSDASNTYSGHLTVAATGGLIVETTVQKAVDGDFASLTTVTASDLTIQSSSSGQGALVLRDEPGTAAATIQLYSKAYIDSHKHWQYIGFPFSDEPEAIDFFTNAYMYRWDEGTTAGWNSVVGSTTLTPFTGYSLTQSAARTYNLTGTLCPTDADQVLSLTYSSQSGSNLFANSWTAPLEIANFRDADFSNSSIEKTIYLYNTGSLAEYEANDGENTNGSSPGQYFAIPVHAAPYAVGLPTVIPPMQGFQLMTTAIGTLTLDYERLTTPYGAGLNTQPLKSPKRLMDDNAPELLRLTVTGVSGQSSSDRLYLLQRSDFTHSFDNGWDGRKLPGDNGLLQLYAIADDGNLSVNATPDILGTQIAFTPGSDTEYILDVLYTGTETLYLYDRLTGLSLPLADNARYTFTAHPSDAASTRFIVTDTNITTGTTATEMDSDMREITVYDLLGHKLISSTSWDDVRTFLSNRQGINLLRIWHNDGSSYTQKIQ